VNFQEALNREARSTKRKDDWFAFDESRPLNFFAGVLHDRNSNRPSPRSNRAVIVAAPHNPNVTGDMLDELADVMSPDHNGTWLRTRSGAIEMSPIASKIQARVAVTAALR
jgi:putative SOS response-associated peptidase YedK